MGATIPSRTRSLVHLITAAILLGTAAVVRERPGTPVLLFALREPMLAAGLVVLMALGVRRPAWLANLATRLCLALLAGITAFTVAEAGCRLAGIDLRRQAARLERVAPYWRLPRVPEGTVFFRRAGPLEWTGQVIHRQLLESGLPAAAYAHEPVITVRYDALGFRNEPRPDAWSIAVAGDSFTELGCVAYDSLFTTVLSRRLGCGVLNLGVAGTGPLSHLTYLERYGLSSQSTDVLVVFFEGNDPDDLLDELRAERKFQRTGERPLRDIQPQTSLLRALGELLSAPRRAPASSRAGIEGVFLGRQGEVPVSLGYPPPARKELTQAMREAFDVFAERYATFAREHHVRPWLAYMPCKMRVIFDRFRLAPEADPVLKTWTPSDLPDFVAELCAGHQIRFLDLTPTLAGQTRATGELMYNHLFDSHLNARGSELVGEALADALRTASTAPTSEVK